MVNLLKKYGGQCNPNLKGILYDQQYEEQKLKKSNIPQRTKNVTAQQANTATGALNEAMSAMKERGERLEKLDNAAASLGNEAANYAVMTKQLKEKTKKKSLFGLKY
jgi:predicted double-glycine peptidase